MQLGFSHVCSLLCHIWKESTYFRANEISDEKKVSILLSVIEGKVYLLLRELLVPVKLTEKSFNKLASKLENVFSQRK